MSELDRAADAIDSGALVVYPTETVYGLAADALEPEAVDRVFEVKGRDRSKPLSFAVPSVPSALRYVRATDRERRFMATFLPGPVTVLCRRREAVPDELTAGRDRVGVRVPDHPLALRLCERASTPITATSANVSGRASAGNSRISIPRSGRPLKSSSREAKPPAPKAPSSTSRARRSTVAVRRPTRSTRGSRTRSDTRAMRPVYMKALPRRASANEVSSSPPSRAKPAKAAFFSVDFCAERFRTKSFERRFASFVMTRDLWSLEP